MKKFIANMRMRTKLIMFFLIVGVVPLLFAAGLSYQQADSALADDQGLASVNSGNYFWQKTTIRSFFLE